MLRINHMSRPLIRSAPPNLFTRVVSGRNLLYKLGVP